MEIRMDSTDVGVTVALETDGSPVLGFNCGRQGQQGQLGIGRATRPAQGTGKGRTFLRTLSTQVVNISKEGGSTTSLDDFWQYLVALTVKKNKKFVLMFKWNFLCFPGQVRWGVEQPGLVESVAAHGRRVE